MTTKPPPVQILVTCPTCKGNGTVDVITGVSTEDGQPDGFREECPQCEGDGVMVAIGETVLEIEGYERAKLVNRQ
jgi:DnaJ-class molecular chaperone